VVGAALTPTFGSTTATSDGFTVVITNYSSAYTWAGTATASGTVVVTGSGSTGLATVTGVAPLTSSTATITTTRTGYTGGTADIVVRSLVGAALTPTFGSTTPTATGFTVQITNYNALYTWAGSATASGTVAINSTTGVITVTRVAGNTSSTATITTARTGYTGGTAAVTATSLVVMSMVSVSGSTLATADSNGYGAVSYSYKIGKYDVTGSQYTAFLNAVAQTDTYGLYNAGMSTNADVAQISRFGTAGTYTYVVKNNTGNRPITYVSWFDCARFTNWMSNGQGSGSTESGAYTLLSGQISGSAPAANPGESFRIPTENEWYKAAYHNGRVDSSSSYYTYATKSNVAPTFSSNVTSTVANVANYNNAIGHATDVGSFSGSGSSYGTFDQSGNVDQWNDLSGTAGANRGSRGGNWGSSTTGNSSALSSSNRSTKIATTENSSTGFRLASPV
jgi:formylglycine-generating enzyme required for sulfatase activity